MTQAFRPEAAFAGAAERFFDLMKSFAPQPPGGTGATAADPADLAGALAGQYEEWLRATQSAGSWFAAPAAGASAGAFAPGAMPWAFAPLPLGMGAATTSEGQRAWELIAQLAQLQAQLAAHWHEIATRASQQFVARLGAASNDAPTLERSLKLYELWVDCAEEAYAATVRRDDFASLQSQLANISAALLLEQRRHAETVARAFGMPTRTEVDAIYAQLKDLHRRLAGLAPAAPVPQPPVAEAANEPVRRAPARGPAPRGAASRGKRAGGKGGRRVARARGRRA
jgi:hypothetical protein